MARFNPLRLHALETRDCPAIVVSATPNLLSITGTPNGALVLTHTAAGPNAFQVVDNGVSFGTYNVTNDLKILLKSRPSDIRINLNSTAGQGIIPGNVSIDLGTGYTGKLAIGGSVDLFDSAATPLGQVRGNYTITGGNGHETLNVGLARTAALTPPTVIVPVSVLGSIFATLSSSSNPTGDSFNLGPASLVGSDVILKNVEGSSIGVQGPGNAAATINRNFIQTLGSTGFVATNIYGNIGGSATVTGGNLNDTFTIAQTDIGVGGQIGGSVTAVLGDAIAGNSFSLLTGTTVTGGINVVSGANSSGIGDLLRIDGSVFGSVQGNLGQGTNTFAFDAAAFIGGNVTLFGGNILNTTDGTAFGASATFAATVNGNVSVQWGNGANTFNITGAVYGSSFRYVGGNFTDDVVYAVSDGAPIVYVDLGGGVNSFRFVTPNASKATVRAAPGSTNTYDDSAIAPDPFPVTLINIV